MLVSVAYNDRNREALVRKAVQEHKVLIVTGAMKDSKDDGGLAVPGRVYPLYDQRQYHAMQPVRVYAKRLDLATEAISKEDRRTVQEVVVSALGSNEKLPSSQPSGFEEVGMCVSAPHCGHNADCRISLSK